MINAGWYYALKSDLAKYDYAMQVGDRSSIFDASAQVGQKIGPFVVGFGVGGFVAKGSKIGDTIETIVKTGKVPDAPNVDAPNTPDVRDVPDTGRTGVQDVKSDKPSQPSPPASLQVENINVENIRPGTREYELLNNPPPNTRIELSNGNVYVTNAQGFVDEVSFQPRLIKEPRDGRQTAVGKQGLDTDVGGHIQACSLGGTCDRVNLFPQDKTFNNSDYKKFENVIRAALEAEAKGGPKVGSVSVKFDRNPPNNPRPANVIVEYTIGGRSVKIPFKNQSGG